MNQAVRPVPRIALTRQEAADALGVGLTTFKEKIAPETLKKFRLKFYGADKPSSTPDREITVEFVAS